MKPYLLDIHGNPVLPSLSGLDNIEENSISDLKIHNNSLLTTCEVQSICNYLASPNGTQVSNIKIYNQNGQVITNIESDNNAIDFSNLYPGLYLLEFTINCKLELKRITIR